MCGRGTHGGEPKRPTSGKRSLRPSGGGGRRPVVVLDRMVLEGEAFVEFGERDREADFRHVERVVVLQDEDAPTVLGPDVNGRADPGLLEHDVTLDRWRRLVLAGLDDAVLRGGAGAQNLEDDDGVADDLGGVSAQGQTTIPSG